MPLIVYCTAVLTSLSDSVSYITFLFSEWRIASVKVKIFMHLSFGVLAIPARTKEVKAAFTRDRIRLEPVRNWYGLCLIEIVFSRDLAGGSGTNRISYLVPNGSIYEGHPIRNCTVSVSNRSCVNRVDPHNSGSDPKRI